MVCVFLYVCVTELVLAATLGCITSISTRYEMSFITAPICGGRKCLRTYAFVRVTLLNVTNDDYNHADSSDGRKCHGDNYYKSILTSPVGGAHTDTRIRMCTFARTHT